MICPRCRETAKVRRTFSGEGGKTQECRCPSCKHTFTVVSLVFEGLSAYKASQALDKGQISLKARTEQA